MAAFYGTLAEQPAHMTTVSGGPAVAAPAVGQVTSVARQGPWIPQGGLQLHPGLAGLAESVPGHPPPMPAAGAQYPIIGVGEPRPPQPHELEELHRIYGGVAGTPAALEPPPTHSNVRVRVRLPQPRVPGAPEFYGGVPKRSSTFGWGELCATQAPDHSLAPVPQVKSKTWYNSYVYMPEQTSHVERQFLDRYIQGPDGEWIDVIKARRMASYLEEKREKAMIEQMERAMVMSGSVVQETRYTDPYSGEHLVACRGELLPKQQLMEQYHAHYSANALREMVSEAQGFDFDNLRVPWPFGRPYRNKQVSQHAYDWFDRQNPYIPSDKSFELLELPSMFVDRHHYDRWGGGSVSSGYGARPQTFPATQAPAERVSYVQT